MMFDHDEQLDQLRCDGSGGLPGGSGAVVVGMCAGRQREAPGSA